VIAFPMNVVYAKNPEHEEFLRNFDGNVKGLYHIAYLVAIEFSGGAKLRGEIETALGKPTYLPNEWYPAKDMIVMFDRAIRAGISSERVGLQTMPTYKRANPEKFEGKSVREGFQLLEQAFRGDTTYGGVSPGLQAEAGQAKVYRKGSPLPCDFFVGVLKRLLTVFSAAGSVEEVECQWKGAPACCFQARWTRMAAPR